MARVTLCWPDCPRSVEAFNSQRTGLNGPLDDVAVGTVEFATQRNPSKSGEIARTVDEKHRVGDGVSLIQFCEERLDRIATGMTREGQETD
jgi:hypothetical protein